MSNSIYAIPLENIQGQQTDLSEFQGRVMLLVNTASACGFTPQYAGLESLYQEFKDQGLVVLGFPCNQFGAQEKGNEQEIQSFCELNFGVSFPLFAKLEVNGPNAHPLFKLLKQQALACWVRKGLNGISPSFWSIAMAKSSSAMLPQPNPRLCVNRFSSCYRINNQLKNKPIKKHDYFSPFRGNQNITKDSNIVSSEFTFSCSSFFLRGF